MGQDTEILAELRALRADVATVITRLDGLDRLNHEQRINQLEQKVAANNMAMLKSGGVGAALATLLQWVLTHGGF